MENKFPPAPEKPSKNLKQVLRFFEFPRNLGKLTLNVSLTFTYRKLKKLNLGKFAGKFSVGKSFPGSTVFYGKTNLPKKPTKTFSSPPPESPAPGIFLDKFF